MKPSAVTPTPPGPPSAILERKTIPLAKIHRSKLNPRGAVGDVSELAKSIAEVGLLQPLVVAPLEDGDYELVAGERRLTALEKIKATEADCTVRDVEADVDLVLAAFAENTMREPLTPLDEARGYRQLIDTFGLTQDAVAKRVHVSPAHVSKRLSLLTLPGAVQKQVSAGKVGATDAYELSRLVGKVPDAPKLIETMLKQHEVGDDLSWQVDEELAVHEGEALAAAVADKFSAQGVRVIDDAGVARYKAVRVQPTGHGWGTDLVLADVKAHATEPCRAMVVKRGHKKPVVTEYCTDPARHAKKGDSEVKATATTTRSTSTSTKSERDRKAAEREANKARREFMRTLVADRRVPGATVQLLALRRYATSGWSVEARAACELLDLEPIKHSYNNTKDWAGTLAKFLKDADEPTLLRVALAKILAEGEERHERRDDHRRFLLDVGYEPTDFERKEWKIKAEAKATDALVDAHIAARTIADDYANQCAHNGIAPGARFHELDAELRDGVDTLERVAEIHAELEAIVLTHLDDHGDVTVGEPLDNPGAGAAEPLTLDVDTLDEAPLGDDLVIGDAGDAAVVEGPLLDAYDFPPINRHEEFLRDDLAKLDPTAPAVIALQQEAYRGVKVQRIPAMMKEVAALKAEHTRTDG